ncbi:hypothetical protein C5C14_05595 [Rathayibacter rathayi]|nr:hypothetical protein [Rathayibacter rathayi]PPF80656.1 hypothetical protein C5C14_05595 [Rathayibacter rathayi]
MSADIFSVIIGIVQSLSTAVVGGLVVHLLARSRERDSQRRTLRIEYLIRAYHSLANATDRAAVTREHVQAAEDAVIDIVLLGEKEEIRAVEGIDSTRDEGGTFSLKPVTEALRTSLRQELQLPTVQTRAMYLRWAPTNLSPSKP